MVAKKNKVTITFTDEANDAFRKFAKITKRNLEEVASDAFRTYMWLLFEQMEGATITAHHKNSKENRDLENLVENRRLARKYLKPFRHLFC